MFERDENAPGRPDLEGDRERLWEVLKNGGIAIIPSRAGYGLSGGSPEAVKRINKAKGRGGHKRNGMLMGREMEREIHIIEPWKREIIDCVTIDYDLPLGVIASYRADHPIFRNVPPDLLATSTAGGTISHAVNNGGGLFMEDLARRSREALHPIFGSSANLTGTGSKARVQDIEPEIIAIADIVLDYGLRPLAHYRVSSTQINFDTMQVTRMGSCYDLISDIVKRHFNWELPPDPGREVNRHGIVNEFALEPVKVD
jgi:tRNA A37 threonylcarbamoyladenosine synthetase subunit TsaC/SUA5/YrdC